MIINLQQELRKVATPKKAKANAWFFKTGKGQYGYGDKFLGVTVPEQRVIAQKYKDLSLDEIKKLLQSEFHEERLVALFILVSKFEKGNDKEKEVIYKFYLANTKCINNWDLVDSSAHKIVGEYLINRDRNILYKLVKSDNLWERRIAIISTAAFIGNREFKDTFQIADLLLNDPSTGSGQVHDLIQKAVGWMLREVGKRVSKEELEKYLLTRYKTMPRTMLRYSIEHFPPDTRQKYLRGQF